MIQELGDDTFSDVDRSLFRYPGVLSADECAGIIERSRPHLIDYVHEEEDPEERVDGYGRHLIRGRLLAGPVDDENERIGADIVQRLWAVFAHVNAEQTGWNIPFDLMRLGVSCYREGHYMDVHVDDERREAPPWDLPHRGISMSVPLSTGHDGGNLVLQTGDGEWSMVPLGPGDAVAFGSSVEHLVLPVTAGERWVLLAWAYTNHETRFLR